MSDKSEEYYKDLIDGWIHKSHLQSFIACPAKLRFLKLEFEKPDQVWGEDDEMSRFVKDKGGFFHEFANYFYVVLDKIIEYRKALEKRHNERMLGKKWTRETGDLLRELVIPEDEQKDPQSPFVIYQAMIDQFLMFEAERLCTRTSPKWTFEQRMDVWKPYAVELKFEKVKNFEPTKKMQEEFGIDNITFKAKGTIDIIDKFKRQERSLLIGEFKTGGWNVKASTKVTSVRRELNFYSFFNTPFKIGKRFWEITHMSCYNPEVPPSIGYLREPLKSASQDAMLKQLIKLVLALEEDDLDRPCMNPWVCSWCKRLDCCPVYYKEQWSDNDGNLQDAKTKRQIQRRQNNTTY